MSKQLWKPGNMLYPLPAVLVSCGDKAGNYNVLTVAWTGTICSDPAMVYVSVRKNRYSHHMLEETGEFYINLTTEALAFATDYCGVKSGKDLNKFEEMHLTPEMGMLSWAPMIKESPVCIACEVVRIEELGSHDMFIANVKGVYADEAYMVGAEAVHYALADKSGVMVTLERTSDAPYKCTCGEVALDLVANNEQKVPLSWITKQANYVTDEFINYARPLILGEVEVPMKDGLPDYVRLDLTKGRI